jgi:hypothetical protein
MVTKNLKQPIISIQIKIILLILIFSFQFFITKTNAIPEITFNPTKKFEILENNSSISFAFEGAYTKAYLQDGFWNFENLRLNNSDTKYNLKVSVTNCSIIITSYRIYNRIYVGENTTRATLSYDVSGPGTQTFILEINPNEGAYGVVIDGIFESLNHGWKLSSEGNPIITGAKEQTRVSYYGYPPSYINRTGDIDEHSVFIFSIVFVVAIIVFASVISTQKKNKKFKARQGEIFNGLGK